MNQANLCDRHVTPQAVRAQLAEILESESFVRARRMQRFLQFIVEEALAGNAAQIGEYSIGTSVFDRGEDFEPAVDPIVRNDARRLRAKLHEYYRHASPGPDRVRIDIPKGGYVPVFLPLESPSARARRVAVFPFEFMSPAPEVEFCGHALCLSLTASLTRVDGVEAVAHGYLKGRSVFQAAAELHLTHAIQGCVLLAGDRCRVIVNLVHIPRATQIWAQEYDFPASEILDAHRRIGGQVLSEMRHLLEEPSPLPAVLAVAA